MDLFLLFTLACDEKLPGFFLSFYFLEFHLFRKKHYPPSKIGDWGHFCSHKGLLLLSCGAETLKWKQTYDVTVVMTTLKCLPHATTARDCRGEVQVEDARGGVRKF